MSSKKPKSKLKPLTDEFTFSPQRTIVYVLLIGVQAYALYQASNSEEWLKAFSEEWFRAFAISALFVHASRMG